LNVCRNDYLKVRAKRDKRSVDIIATQPPLVGYPQTEYAIGETDAEGEVTVIVLGITITCAQGYHLGVSIFCTYVTGEQFRLFGQVVVLSRQ